MEIYSVNLHIQSEYRKIRTRKTTHLDTSHSESYFRFSGPYLCYMSRNTFKDYFPRDLWKKNLIARPSQILKIGKSR